MVETSEVQNAPPLPQELLEWLRENATQEMAAVARKVHLEMLPLLTAGLSRGEEPDPVYVSIWRASILYIAKCLTLGKEGREGRLHNGGIPLTKILRVMGADLFGFFRELPATLCNLEPKLQGIVGRGISLEKCIGESVGVCQTNLFLLVIMARKYKELFCKLFLVEPKHVSSKRAYQMGWLIMMIVKPEVVPQNPCLLSCFHLLVCICNFLFINTPQKTWRPAFWKPTEVGPLNTLQCLSEMSKMKSADHPQEMEEMMKRVDGAVTHLLEQNEAIHKLRSEEHEDSRIQLSATYYEGLMAEEGVLLDQCLEFLSSKYEVQYNASKELDERDFIVDGFIPKQPAHPGPQCMVPPPTQTYPAMPVSARSAAGASTPPNAPFRSMARCLQSPLPMHRMRGKPATPVSEVLNSSAWLKGITKNQAPEPSKRIKDYFGMCDCAIGTRIQQRAYQVAHLLFAKSPAGSIASTMNWADIQYEGIQGIVLYYQVLESVLVAEEERTHKKNFSSLLASNSFHVALLGCSFEIIASTYKMPSMEFPKLLSKLRLKAFDLIKIIEPFVKHTKTLPTDLKRHLFLIEEQIIESMAWQPGSSIYTLIVGCCQRHTSSPSPCTSMPATPTTSSPVPPLRVFSPPTHPLSGLSPGARSRTSAFKLFTSPLRKGSGDSSSPKTAPKGLQGPLPPRLTCADDSDVKKHPARTVLNDFFRKVLKLSAFRLFDMKSILMIRPIDPVSIVHQVYSVVQHALYEQTHLFYNRHLDQILLSGLYGVCKVNTLNINFKDIIGGYQMQPHNRPEVYKTVVLEQSDPDLKAEKLGDIIEFYNSVFLPSMRSFLLNNCQVMTPASKGTLEGVHGTPTSRRQHLPETPNGSLLSPQSGALPAEDRTPPRRIHNVHVSPVKTPQRSESGGACSSRAMHAFVGKTTHPYQTPTQELGSITARLNQYPASGIGVQGTAYQIVGSSNPLVMPSCGCTDATDLASKVKMEPGAGTSGNEASPGPVWSSQERRMMGRGSSGVAAGVKMEPEAGQNAMEDSTRSPSVVSSTGSGSPVGSTKLTPTGRKMPSQRRASEEVRAKRQRIDMSGPWKASAERKAGAMEIEGPDCAQ